MDAAEYLLDGLEAWLELERELGARTVECDKSLLAAPQAPLEQPQAPSAPLAPQPPAPVSSPPAPPPRAPAAPAHTRPDFVFLHDRPLSEKGMEMMAKIIVAMGKDASSAPIVFEGAVPPAKLYVILGWNALKKWVPGAKAAPGEWIKTKSGKDALVTYSPEKIVRYKVVTDEVTKMKQEMWKSLKSVMQRIAGGRGMP